MLLPAQRNPYRKRTLRNSPINLSSLELSGVSEYLMIGPKPMVNFEAQTIPYHHHAYPLLAHPLENSRDGAKAK